MVHMQSAVLLILLITLSSCQKSHRPPNILEPNSSVSKYQRGNSNVTLECRAEGTPDPTYRWLRNGDPVIVNELIQFDSSSGRLTIQDFTKREEGTYICIASNVFDTPDGRITASSFSPPIKLYQTRVEKFKDAPDSFQQVTEYGYALLKCGNKGEIVADDINTNWYESENSKDVRMDGGRLFIDQSGNLHFSYCLVKDTTINFKYLCGLSSASDKTIYLGNTNYLTVDRVANPTAIKPQLQYSNSGAKSLKFGKARLECVFSGYDPSPPHMPVTRWFDDSGKEITGGSSTDKYMLSDDKRVLTINNLQEEDDRSYFCQAHSNSGDSSKMEVYLNVTSAPIFHPDGAPKDQTVVENVDVNFNCDARSASNENLPSSPIWYINGMKMGQHSDPTKFKLSNDNKRLTVMKVKRTDILCVQCEVTNSEDTTWGDACLTVILPIKIEKRPAERQEIDHGDVVDLTVTASSEPTIALSHRWEFNNVSYVTDPPPFVTFDPKTNLAYINTSELTEAQYNSIGGTYRRVFFHTYQNESVDTVVVLKDKPVVIPVATAAVDMWIIGLIIGIIFLLIVIIIIIFVICRKKQEGDYNVDKKETGAGLDPEKELKDKGFNDYSRPDYDDYDNYPDKKPRGDLEYDDVPIGGDDESLGEYGDEDDTHFNEDGSFIGIYQKKQQPSSKNHESTI